MMKRYQAVFWLWWLVTACVAAENKVVFTDPLKVIVVKYSDPVFRIVLQSNPTIGYSWALKNYDPKLILPLNRRFYPAPSKRLIGAPGYERWTFKVKPGGFMVPQLTSVTLIYFRPWDEQGAQVSNFKVVTVNAD